MSFTYRKLQVVEKGKDFHKATKVLKAPIPTAVAAADVLVKNFYAGVNATDINSIDNRYGAKQEVPYNIGLEALGQVVMVGSAVRTLSPGDYVVVYFTGGYSEYQVVPASACSKIPTPAPEYLTLNVSALTAAVSIGEIARPKEGEVALVTAAAGGTGSFAVQLLKKKYKCRVVGTCSTAEKAEYLRSIGCDVAVDYTKDTEDVTKQLALAAPDGFDIVYESVGGSIRELAMENIALHGRIIFIGSIGNYKDGSAWTAKKTSIEQAEKTIKNGLILRRGATVAGFLLPHYRDVIPAYFADLLAMYTAGALIVRLDDHGKREGLDRVQEAVAYLHSGKSYGKVIVKIADPGVGNKQ